MPGVGHWDTWEIIYIQRLLQSGVHFLWRSPPAVPDNSLWIRQGTVRTPRERYPDLLPPFSIESFARQGLAPAGYALVEMAKQFLTEARYLTPRETMVSLCYITATTWVLSRRRNFFLAQTTHAMMTFGTGALFDSGVLVRAAPITLGGRWQ